MPKKTTSASPRTRTPAGEKISLRLYVAGATTRSRQAVLLIRRFCETELAGRYDLKVIDIYQQPELARLHQIVVTPTLIKEIPLPVRRHMGNLAALDSLLVELDLAVRSSTAT